MASEKSRAIFIFGKVKTGLLFLFAVFQAILSRAGGRNNLKTQHRNFKLCWRTGVLGANWSVWGTNISNGWHCGQSHKCHWVRYNKVPTGRVWRRTAIRGHRWGATPIPTALWEHLPRCWIESQMIVWKSHHTVEYSTDYVCSVKRNHLYLNILPIKASGCFLLLGRKLPKYGAIGWHPWTWPWILVQNVYLHWRKQI